MRRGRDHLLLQRAVDDVAALGVLGQLLVDVLRPDEDGLAVGRAPLPLHLHPIIEHLHPILEHRAHLAELWLPLLDWALEEANEAVDHHVLQRDLVVVKRLDDEVRPAQSQT